MLADNAKLISADDHVIEHAKVSQDRLPERFHEAGLTASTFDGLD